MQTCVWCRRPAAAGSRNHNGNFECGNCIDAQSIYGPGNFSSLDAQRSQVGTPDVTTADGAVPLEYAAYMEDVMRVDRDLRTRIAETDDEFDRLQAARRRLDEARVAINEGRRVWIVEEGDRLPQITIETGDQQ